MAMSLASVQTFFNTTFTKFGENGTYLVNTGATFTPFTNVLMLARGPMQMPEELGTIPNPNFNIMILQTTLGPLAINPKRGDRITFRGVQYKINEIDAITYSYNGTIIAFNLILG